MRRREVGLPRSLTVGGEVGAFEVLTPRPLGATAQNVGDAVRTEPSLGRRNGARWNCSTRGGQTPDLRWGSDCRR
jgi:hypothetical protein